MKLGAFFLLTPCRVCQTISMESIMNLNRKFFSRIGLAFIGLVAFLGLHFGTPVNATPAPSMPPPATCEHNCPAPPTTPPVVNPPATPTPPANPGCSGNGCPPATQTTSGATGSGLGIGSGSGTGTGIASPTQTSVNAPGVNFNPISVTGDTDVRNSTIQVQVQPSNNSSGFLLSYSLFGCSPVQIGAIQNVQAGSLAINQLGGLGIQVTETRLLAGTEAAAPGMYSRIQQADDLLLAAARGENTDNVIRVNLSCRGVATAPQQQFVQQQGQPTPPPAQERRVEVQETQRRTPVRVLF